MALEVAAAVVRCLRDALEVRPPIRRHHHNIHDRDLVQSTTKRTFNGFLIFFSFTIFSIKNRFCLDIKFVQSNFLVWTKRKILERISKYIVRIILFAKFDFPQINLVIVPFFKNFSCTLSCIQKLYIGNFPRIIY